MKSIKDLIPRRRPGPLPVSSLALDGVQDAKPAEDADADLTVDQNDRERARLGRDRIPVADQQLRPPERQTMEDLPKDLIAVSTRPKEQPPADQAPDIPAIWDLEAEPGVGRRRGSGFPGESAANGPWYGPL